jgi:hypothetical protein
MRKESTVHLAAFHFQQDKPEGEHVTPLRFPIPAATSSLPDSLWKESTVHIAAFHFQHQYPKEEHGTPCRFPLHAATSPTNQPTNQIAN